MLFEKAVQHPQKRIGGLAAVFLPRTIEF